MLRGLNKIGEFFGLNQAPEKTAPPVQQSEVPSDYELQVANEREAEINERLKTALATSLLPDHPEDVEKLRLQKAANNKF